MTSEPTRATRRPAAPRLPDTHQPDSPDQETPLPALTEEGTLDHRLLTAADILQLQRTIGNEAVMRLLAERPAPDISAASHQHIQRVEGTLIKPADKLKVGTRVKILKDVYPRFQVEEIATQKTYWIQGAVKDYIAADSGGGNGADSAPKMAVVKAEPPLEKVVEEVVTPQPSAQPKTPAPALDKAVKQAPLPSPDTKPPTDKQVAAVKSGPVPAKKKAVGPSLNERLQSRDYPTMGRVQDATWDVIEPQLDSYGTFTKEEKLKLKDKLEKSPIKPRGIPDLIEMTFRSDPKKKDYFKKTLDKVKADLSGGVPDLATWRQTGNKTTRGARGDTRPPHTVREGGGLFGWDAGIVTLSHAKSMIRNVMEMTTQEQETWIAGWKWPTPDRKEANPWVATGIGKEGGQKGGGEFIYQLPLIFHAAGGKPMVIATDTGSLDTASVIGVRLEETGEEVVMLTGIPWKYVTHWSGSLEGQPPLAHDANTAADATKKLADQQKSK